MSGLESGVTWHSPEGKHLRYLRESRIVGRPRAPKGGTLIASIESVDGITRVFYLLPDEDGLTNPQRGCGKLSDPSTILPDRPCRRANLRRKVKATARRAWQKLRDRRLGRWSIVRVIVRRVRLAWRTMKGWFSRARL